MVPFEQSKCGGCTALCCRYFALEVDAPDEPEDFENLRWYLIHEDVNIFVEDDEWYVQIFRKCTWLGSDNKCSRYDDRPTICREYDDEWCDKDGDAEDALVFRSIDQLEAYRDDWVAKYEADQERKRRKRKKAAKKAAATRKLNKEKGKGRKVKGGKGRKKKEKARV